MPRFVILEHDWPTLHYDIMLEMGDVLKSWRATTLPAPGETIRVEPNVDHRLAYLDYEGPVSGDRGSVRRVISGTWQQRSSDPTIFELTSEMTAANLFQITSCHDWRLTRLKSGRAETA